MSVIPTSAEFIATTQAELVRYMADNHAGPRKTLCPVGGRTTLQSGTFENIDVLVSTSGLSRVVDYPARDMTITVEAGIRISELQSILATERQRLPIDLAQPGQATIGGAIAANASGPRRYGHGTFRDYVIGISAVDAQGRLFKSGGRVVKNVAGYDVCKLLVGSQGTLAVVTQVTLKLRPIVESTSLLWCRFQTLDQIEAVLEKLLRSDARPVAMDVLNASAAKRIAAGSGLSDLGDSSILCVGVEGVPHEVAWQVETLKREIESCGHTSIEVVGQTEANRIWEALTEFSGGVDNKLTFQANVLPSKCIEFVNRATDLGIAIQAHAGNGILVGRLPEQVETAGRAKVIVDELRQLARREHGNLIVKLCNPEWKSQIEMFGEPDFNWTLMRRLKKQLDPDDLLSPGRLFG